REHLLARARVTRQPVDHGVAALGRGGVGRRQPDRDPARRRVAQRVAGERAALDRLDDRAHRRGSDSGAYEQVGDTGFISATKRLTTFSWTDGFNAARGLPGHAASTEISGPSFGLSGPASVSAPARMRPRRSLAAAAGRGETFPAGS